MGEDNINEITKLYGKYNTGVELNQSEEDVKQASSTTETNPVELYITAEDYFSNPTQQVSENAKNKFLHFKKLAEQGDPRLYLYMLVSCSE